MDPGEQRLNVSISLSSVLRVSQPSAGIRRPREGCCSVARLSACAHQVVTGTRQQHCCQHHNVSSGCRFMCHSEPIRATAVAGVLTSAMHVLTARAQHLQQGCSCRSKRSCNWVTASWCQPSAPTACALGMDKENSCSGQALLLLTCASASCRKLCTVATAGLHYSAQQFSP